jgi:hypothetical protein
MVHVAACAFSLAAILLPGDQKHDRRLPPSCGGIWTDSSTLVQTLWFSSGRRAAAFVARTSATSGSMLAQPLTSPVCTFTIYVTQETRSRKGAELHPMHHSPESVRALR